MQRLQAWVSDGYLPEPASGGTRVPAKPSVFWVMSLSGIAAFFVGLAYLTGVMPQKSDAGQLVTGFVDDVRQGRITPAYQRLAQSYRDKHDLAAFEADLPKSFRAPSGFKINGLASATSFDGHKATCIDGWLEGVRTDSRYAFAIRIENDTPRIWGWREGKCDKQAWWHAREGATK